MVRKLEAGADVEQVLARDRLGIPGLLFFVMSSAAPFTVVAGMLTTAYAVTANTHLPVAFAVVGIVVAIFSVGYVAMSRHLPHAGAFYAYIAQINRPLGVAGAWVALVSYDMLQVGLYGGTGVAVQPLVKDWFGADVPWYVFAFAAWLLVAVLGVLRVDVNGQVLAVLLVAEVAVILIYNLSWATHPAHGVDFSGLAPGGLFNGGVGAILAIAVLGFVGFESAVVFAEEARPPRRTLPAATYLSILVIAFLYGVSAWAMGVTAGTDKIATAAKDGPGFVFATAGSQMGDTMSTIGQVLFTTSLLAAMISFHNTIARYMFALGRERVLPSAFARTSASGAPLFGSLLQSAIGFVVILIFAVSGADPMVKLFYTGGTTGALGILLLLFVTSIAVLVFFARDRRGESTWHAVIAPALSVVGVGAILWLVVDNFADLLGVPPDDPLRWGMPIMFVLVGVGGVIYGLILQQLRPEAYAAIGLGNRATTAAISAGGRHAPNAAAVEPQSAGPGPGSW